MVRQQKTTKEQTSEKNWIRVHYALLIPTVINGKGKRNRSWQKLIEDSSFYVLLQMRSEKYVTTRTGK